MDSTDERGTLRADARRNRESILRTAARHFAARGVETSLDEIARDAGVGPGTLYRHFPSRETLLAATLRDQQAQLHVRADAARELSASDDALTEWLRALQDYLCTYSGLPAPLLAAIEKDGCQLGHSCETLVALTGEFLSRAQKEGRARTTITARDLFLAALGNAWVVSRSGLDESEREALRVISARGYLEPKLPR
jgi:AcrR family transcriptional regulator